VLDLDRVQEQRVWADKSGGEKGKDTVGSSSVLCLFCRSYSGRDVCEPSMSQTIVYQPKAPGVDDSGGELWRGEHFPGEEDSFLGENDGSGTS